VHLGIAPPPRFSVPRLAHAAAIESFSGITGRSQASFNTNQLPVRAKRPPPLEPLKPRGRRSCMPRRPNSLFEVSLLVRGHIPNKVHHAHAIAGSTFV